MYINKDHNSPGPPGVPNSWGEPDAKYIDALYCILADSETMEITRCQSEFLEASTRYYELKSRTSEMGEELSGKDRTNRICEQFTRREIMDKKFNEAVEEARREITDEKFNKAVEEKRRRQTQYEKQGNPAPSQPTEDHHKTIAPNIKEEGHDYNPPRNDKDIPAWVRLLAEQVRLDCVPLYSDIPLCGEDSHLTPPTGDHYKTIAPNTKEEGHNYNPSRDDKDIPAWVQLLAEQVRLCTAI